MRINRLLICCAIFIFGHTLNAHAQKIIQTVAGSGSTFAGGLSGDGGPAVLSRLNANYMLALDASGNLYFADGGNNRIRRIDAATGVITTVVTGLNNPVGIAVDPSGNLLYIGDNGAHRVRRYNIATSTLTTIAGIGAPGGYVSDGVAATSARINGPRGVAVDAAGNVYFADAGNNRIRMVTAATGLISTIGGNGTGGAGIDGVAATSTSINNPRGVYVDAAGNVYFADMGNHRIRRIAAGTLMLSTVAGIGAAGYTGDGAAATNAQIDGPTDMTFDASGNMYVSDANNYVIRFVNTSGTISTIAGSGTTGWAGDGNLATAAPVRLGTPVSVAVMPNGSYYISDRGTHRIRQVMDNYVPTFVKGSRIPMTVCMNSTAVDIRDTIAVVDTDLNQNLTWTVVSPPPAPWITTGSFGGFPSNRATAGTPASLRPSTVTSYTPLAGFAGMDSFVVRISDGYAFSYDTIIVTVLAPATVAAIAGPTSVCEASSITLTNASAPTGVWSSTNTTVAVVTDVAGDGAVTGTGGGTAVISYTVSNFCNTVASTHTITVIPLATAGTITGTGLGYVCMGSPLSLSATAPGGTWSSSTGDATVSSTGVVTPVSAGATVISYTVSNVCNTSVETASLNIFDLPYAGVITGPTTVCEAGATMTLTNLTPGGVWTAQNGNATVAGGVVTGVTAGTNVISYTYTNACGPDVATYAITVLPLANPGTITGATNFVCVGGVISLSDAITGGTWSASSGNVTVNTSGDVTGITAGTAVISYEMANSCGSSYATFVVNIVNSPYGGVITGPASVCVGANITMSNVVTGGIWSTTTGNATISGSGLVSGVTAGADTVNYAVTLSCGTTTVRYPITVNPLAVPGTITGAGAACLGSSTTLTSSVPGGAWSSSNTAIATVVGGSVTAVMAGSVNILYTVTNGCGPVSVTHPMVVAPIITSFVTVSATPGFTTCAGSMVTYIPVPVNGGSAPTYDWKLNGTTVSTGGSISIVPNNGDVLLVTMTSSAACLTAPTATATNVLNVNPVVIPSVTISSGIYTPTVCVGTYTMFTATAVNGGTAPTYQWTVNGVISGTGNPFYYYPVNGDLVTAELTSSSTCATPTMATSNTITMTVDPANSQIPTVSILATPGSTVCNKTPVTFIANTSYGGISPSLLWTRNGVSVATGPTFTYTPGSGDVIKCMLASSSTCLLSPAFDTVYSTDMIMSVLSETPPTVAISVAPSPTVGRGENAVLTAIVAHPTPTITYKWFVNGTEIIGATSNTFTYSQPDAGSAIVNCVINSGDVCNTTSISNMVNLTISALGVAQMETGSNLQLMPNPNNGSFTIAGTVAADSKDVTIEILNIVGQVVYHDQVTAQNGSLNTQINMGNELANGVYMLNVTADGVHKVIRFSVNR